MTRAVDGVGEKGRSIAEQMGAGAEFADRTGMSGSIQTRLQEQL